MIAASGSSPGTTRGTGRASRILVVLFNYGYWGEELADPLDGFDRVGFEVEFATSTVKRPVALATSLNPNYVDPPLGRTVTTPEMAAKIREIDDVGPSRSDRSRRLNAVLSGEKLVGVLERGLRRGW